MMSALSISLDRTTTKVTVDRVVERIQHQTAVVICEHIYDQPICRAPLYHFIKVNGAGMSGMWALGQHGFFV